MAPRVAWAALLAVTLARAFALAALPDRAYTLRELLDRSDVVFVAEVAIPEGSKEGSPQKSGLLRVRETLKGVAPEGEVPFRVDGPPLPAGAGAVWFLASPGPGGVFVIDHPQCAYDLSHRALVNIGIRTPRRIRKGYYLRREDEVLAERVRRAREKRALATVRPGPTPEGLALVFEVLERTPRAGTALLARFTLTNGGTKPLLTCDSAQECYFVVAERGPVGTTTLPGRRGPVGTTTLPGRRGPVPGRDDVPDASGAPEGRATLWSRLFRTLSLRDLARRPEARARSSRPEVAKAGAAEIRGQEGLGIGLLISEHDFAKLAPGQRITRSLTVSPDYLRALREPGAVSMRGVYHYRRPESPLVDLPADAWEGAVASESVEIRVLAPLRR